VTEPPAQYLRRRFRVPDDRLDSFTAELWEDGPLGLELRANGVDVYYRAGAAPPWVGSEGDLELVEEEVLADGDWLAGWREASAPFAVGARFWVDPGEPRAASAPAGRHLLRLPARRAFGTGGHASTRLAVEILEQTPIAGLEVLDLGAGSGILSFACRLLGARRVVGIEREVESVLVAGANRRLNGIAVDLVGGTLDALADASFDVIAANLLSSHLLAQIAPLAARLRPGGALVYSGALAVERRELLARFRALDLALRGERVDGDWCAFRLRSERRS